jgi:hypothetical protein
VLGKRFGVWGLRLELWDSRFDIWTWSASSIRFRVWGGV